MKQRSVTRENRSFGITNSISLLLGLVASGCYVPDPPILSKPRTSVLYDTKYEKESLSDKPRPQIMEGIWEPYFETLAEPVSVTAWNDSESRWQILFATNRAVSAESNLTSKDSPESPSATKVRFGNEVLTKPVLGMAEIRLPHRQRGTEPAAPVAKTSLLAKSLNLVSSSKQQTVVSPDSSTLVSTASLVPDADFQVRLHDQLRRSRQKDVLLFVHGFNVDFESSLIRTAQLGLDIPFNGALVAYSWPTQGGVMNYESDEPVNAASVAPFTQFLSWMIENLPSDSRLKIVVHSMGNRIVLKGINQLPAITQNPKPIETLCLCAPDVGIADYQSLMPGVVDRCNRVVLYASETDGALKISKSLHLEQRSGDSRVPVTMQGVDLIDCSAVDLSFLGHSYFSGNVSVLTDLFGVLKEGKTPSQRAHLKQRQTSSGGEYWVFHKHPDRVLWTWHFENSANVNTNSP